MTEDYKGVELENKNSEFTERNVDFYYLIGILWRYKKLIFGTTFIVGVLSIIYVLVATPYYQSSASIYPINKEDGGILKQLSQTLGISNKTKGYYIFDVLKSRRISTEIIYSKYLPLEEKDSVNLIQFWNLDGSDVSENRKLEKALILLGSKVSLHEDKETSLITISAVTKDKKISKMIVDNYCSATINYLNNAQQTSTSKSVEFTQNRLEVVNKNLIEAQNDIVKFQEENTSIVSPELSMELKKKVENMELLKSVAVLLGKELELLKIEEVKENPIINILDIAEIVDKPVRPQKRVIVILNTFLSFVFSFIGVILKEKAVKYNVINKLKDVITQQ